MINHELRLHIALKCETGKRTILILLPPKIIRHQAIMFEVLRFYDNARICENVNPITTTL